MTRILHLADLHIGKRLDDYSLIEDQSYILDRLLESIEAKNIDAVIIAGDVYDLKSPSQEALALFDSFITRLARMNREVFIVSGNHDSDERVGYLGSLIAERGIHVGRDAKSSLTPVTYKGINFYLLPYVNRFDINNALDSEFTSFQEAFEKLIDAMNIDETKTNILVSHQAFRPAEHSLARSVSENTEIGGVEEIPGEVFAKFDYAALGHIHKAQNVNANGRYPGALLKYHSGEADHKKTFTVIDVDGKTINREEFEIKPLRDVRKIKGTFEEIIKNPEGNPDDYVRFVLTDTAYVMHPMEKLKHVYPHALGIEYERHAVEASTADENVINVEDVSAEELFSTFYEKQTGEALTELQQSVVLDALKRKEEE